MIKKIDKYIIGKFLGTFFYAIILILMIVIVFDISERMEDFLTKKPPVSAIVFEYYFNFIPFFVNLFSPLFTFIAVIYFTSRMAYRSEIIAILGSGISFSRMLMPYLFSALVIAALSLYLNHFVIPHSNGIRLAFEERYIRSQYYNNDKNIHRQIGDDSYIYFQSYNSITNTGYQFSFEKIKEGMRNYYLKCDYLKWDSVSGKWHADNYFIRQLNGMKETVTRGSALDTVFNFSPAEFGKRENKMEAMQTPELKEYIERERLKGTYRIPFYEVELYRRTAFPFATFVLTIIGTSVASRRVRGGIGWHVGLGLMLAFTYILFMQVCTVFATNGVAPAMLAVWIPNIIFTAIALFMLKYSPK